MSGSPSQFVWYDVMTSDLAAAESFYKSVIGWTAADSGLPDRPYTLFSMGPDMVAGVMPIPEDARAMGAQPCWTGYIGVDDVDDYAGRVTAAGGAVRRAPEDIPGVGRFAVVADPQGAAFILFKATTMPPPAPESTLSPGHVGWHELHATDWEAAFGFYSGLFGWTKTEAMDMGPMGTYQMFGAGGPTIGGMMNRLPEVPAPFWLFYFVVDAIDAARDRVAAGGGKVLQEPHQVPGGLWTLQCVDPQGAIFALVAPQR